MSTIIVPTPTPTPVEDSESLRKAFEGWSIHHISHIRWSYLEFKWTPLYVFVLSDLV
jgi:hypothetical protein